jgi:hypothetical protein
MIYEPKHSDWEILMNTFANCNEGDILLDPNVANDLQAEFEVSKEEIEKAVESAYIDNPRTFNVASFGEYDHIRDELIDKFGDPNDEEKGIAETVDESKS